MNENIIQRVNQFVAKHPIITMQNFLKHEFADSAKKDPLWGLLPNVDNPEQKFSDLYLHMLLYVRNLFKESYIAVEGADSITQKSWASSKESGLNGGGIMTVMRGKILEKSAVNLSVVAGKKYPGLNTGSKIDEQYANRPFLAAGVSLISHPKNPFAPIMHFNIRVIKIFGENSVFQWMGGGADLTPMEAFEEDTKDFHDALKCVCERSGEIANYDRFQKWADEYFYIPHRKEIRGVGGIFFDYLPIESDTKTDFLFDLGQYVAHAYAKILARRVDTEYNDDHVNKHHYWRGRYAEFNLVYDRGTRFGLMSGGNHEAIFCSLPPQVRW